MIGDLPTCRCFVPGDFVPGLCSVPEEEARHLVRVRRQGPGDRVLLLNGRGDQAEACIRRTGKRDCEVEVLEVTHVPRWTPRVTLVIGALKPSAWDELLPHLAELGVERIIRWQSRHAISDIPEEKREMKTARWRDRLIQACKQSANPWLPEVRWADCPEQVSDQLPPEAVHRVAALQPNALPLRGVPTDSSRPLVAWVGPEGDFSAEELDWILTAHGARPVSLGPTILRAETAALALVAFLRLSA